MKIVSTASAPVILLGALLAMAGSRPVSAAEKTPTPPRNQRTETHARPAAPSLNRQPRGRQMGGRQMGGREPGSRREGEQAPFGNPYIPALPRVPAPVQTIIGGVLGGMFRQPQPVTPAGYWWYWCGASGQYYPSVATCPSGWRPVRPR
jgi:hypothetical protein